MYINTYVFCTKYTMSVVALSCPGTATSDFSLSAGSVQASRASHETKQRWLLGLCGFTSRFWCIYSGSITMKSEFIVVMHGQIVIEPLGK